MSGRRGIHTKPVGGMTTDWLTPPGLIKSLGSFDLDPCAHPQQFFPTAACMIHPPKCGLKATWMGSVWLNPPYGSGLKHWLKKMAEHGNGVALVPARTEVDSWFWPYIWESADAILFVRGRLSFHKPDGSLAGNAGHGSCLAAYGTEWAIRLAKSGIKGKLILGKTL